MTTAVKEVVLKNPNLAPVSMDQLKRHVPSVFATGAHEDVSTRYGFASTAKILTALEQSGYVVVEARAYLRRDPARESFTKHMLRLRPAGDIRKLAVGDVVPQVVLINSHDRSSLLHLLGGMNRLVCDNGLLVSTADFIEPIKVRHTNNIIAEVMANVSKISADVGKVTEVIKRMSAVHINEKKQLAYARSALQLRNGGGGGINAAALLVPRRDADKGDSVWKVYNRVQENMIRGGIASMSANGRNTATRPVLGVNGDLSINAGLWELTMATIAKAKA